MTNELSLPEPFVTDPQQSVLFSNEEGVSKPCRLSATPYLISCWDIDIWGSRDTNYPGDVSGCRLILYTTMSVRRKSTDSIWCVFWCWLLIV